MKNDAQTWDLISENDRYRQVLLLPNGTLYATTEDRILMSKDHGKSWKDITGSGFRSFCNYTYIFPDPRHDDLICVALVGNGIGFGKNMLQGIAYAKDERFQWKQDMRGPFEHATTAEFFRRDCEISFGERFDRPWASLSNYFDYDFQNSIAIEPFDIVPAKSRFEVQAGRAVSIPVAIVFQEGFARKMRRWKQLAAAGQADPKPKPVSVKLPDQKIGLGCWGIRVAHNGKRIEKLGPSEAISVSPEKPRENENWQIAEVSEAAPYRRTIALSDLYDFSEAGEYQVQLVFNLISYTGGGSEGGMIGRFSGQVFTVVVNPRK